MVFIGTCVGTGLEHLEQITRLFARLTIRRSCLCGLFFLLTIIEGDPIWD